MKIKLPVACLATLFMVLSCYKTNTTNGNGACPEGLVECDGYCMNVQSDFLNCGECSQACPSSEYACVSGECILWCAYADVSSADELIPYLQGEGWDAIGGVNRYITVTGEINVRSADIGEHVIFSDKGIDGITFEEPIEYGFDPIEHYCNWYEYPQYPTEGYRSAAFNEVTFRMETETLEPNSTPDSPSTNCPADMYCIYEFTPPSTMCCCTGEDFRWDIVDFFVPIHTCESAAGCSQFTGYHPSQCYESYDRYIAVQAPSLHKDCRDETGHLVSGGTCTCEVVEGDFSDSIDGVCQESGKCKIDWECSFYCYTSDACTY